MCMVRVTNLEVFVVVPFGVGSESFIGCRIILEHLEGELGDQGLATKDVSTIKKSRAKVVVSLRWWERTSRWRK